MKIIGTGLSGLVGSRLTQLFGTEHQFIDFSLEANVDILDYSTLSENFARHAKDTAAVIHLAAFTDTNQAWEQRGDKQGLCYRLNVTGTKHLVDLCQKYQKYLVYISTDSVFDGEKETAYTETDLPSPLDWYGATKKMGEDLVSTLPSHAITRISFPYRAHFDRKKDLIRKIIDGFKIKKLNPFFTDQTITPTFIDDLAPAFLYFLKEKPQGIYHLTGSTSLSPYHLAQEIAKTFDLDSSLINPSSLKDYVASQPPGSRPWQKSMIMSNHKAKTLGLNFSTFPQGLQKLKNRLYS